MDSWRAAAACRGVDQSAFFVGVGESSRKAKAICATCPVIEPCLEWALDHFEVGVWGGTTHRERRAIRRERRRVA